MVEVFHFYMKCIEVTFDELSHILKQMNFFFFGRTWIFPLVMFPCRLKHSLLKSTRNLFALAGITLQ